MPETFHQNAEESAAKECSAFQGLETFGFSPEQPLKSMQASKRTALFAAETAYPIQKQTGRQFQIAFGNFDVEEHGMVGSGMERIKSAGKFTLGKQTQAESTYRKTWSGGPGRGRQSVFQVESTQGRQANRAEVQHGRSLRLPCYVRKVR